MSLLEDVFLQDEAGEAQELERIIEGDEYDDRPRPISPNSDDDSEKEDEAEEDKRKVDPASAKSKRVVKNPRFTLNPARLTGPRGIQVLPDHFKDFKFKGKGYEKEDLDLVLKNLEHWAYRLYPKFKFGDCLKKIEMLGKKRPVMVHLHKIRSEQLRAEPEARGAGAAPEDEFDALLRAPRRSASPSLSEEQRERMLRNRRLAEERRLARLEPNVRGPREIAAENVEAESPDVSVDRRVEGAARPERTSIMEENAEVVSKTTAEVNVPIENDDTRNLLRSDEDEVVTNEPIPVDVHDGRDLKDIDSNVLDGSDTEAPAAANECIDEDTSRNASDVMYENANGAQMENDDGDTDKLSIEEENCADSYNKEDNTIKTKDSLNNDFEEIRANETMPVATECCDSECTNSEVPIQESTENNTKYSNQELHNVDEMTRARGDTHNLGHAGEELEDIMDVDFSDDF